MELSTSFDGLADDWDERAGEYGDERGDSTASALINALSPVQGKAIYDLGCGNGALARRLVRAGALSVIASDISPRLIKLASARDTTAIQYMNRRATDFTRISSSSVDAVVLHRAAFYIEHFGRIVDGARRVLTSGGSLVFDVHHPLLPAARKVAGRTVAYGESLDDLNRIWASYSQPHSTRVTGTDSRGNAYSYACLKRPLQYYVNACLSRGMRLRRLIEVEGSRATTIPTAIVLSMENSVRTGLRPPG